MINVVNSERSQNPNKNNMHPNLEHSRKRVKR